MHTQFNKDVSDYKSNFWKGLTLRQTIFGGLSVFSFVFFRLILTIWFEGSLLNILGFGFAFIFAFLGFFKKDRLTAEEFTLIVARYIQTPKVLNCANKPIDFESAPIVLPEEEKPGEESAEIVEISKTDEKEND